MKNKIFVLALLALSSFSSCDNVTNISKDEFCNKKFVMDVGITDGELGGERTTIINCDGTYLSGSSYLGLASLSGNSPEYDVESNERDYSGTWEVVQEVSEELKEEVRKYGLDHNNYTLIKYNSSNGISGYCLYYKVNTDYMLTPLYLNQVPQNQYMNSGSLGIWSGFEE